MRRLLRPARPRACGVVLGTTARSPACVLAAQSRVRWQRARGFATADEMPATRPEGVEFCILPYDDLPEFGFDRGREFCMLALRHPVFETCGAEERKVLYAQKRQDRERRTQVVFEKCDTDRAKSLDAKQLCQAMRMVGMPAVDAVAHGLIYRHGRKGDGRIHQEEFANVVTEIWGRVPEAVFSSSLAKMDASLVGMNSVSFVGRQSPAAWVLRLLRNAWPYALKRVAIMQNTRDNPNFELDRTTMIIDTYEGQNVQGITTAMDLAEIAARQPPTARGGLLVRMVPTNIERFPEGGVHTVVPFRGLPENRPANLLGQMKRWFKR
mmetsp:Transcript_54113/g.150106  ORF Transcript_54113/g.150106 Transcript_54113/m.150106 type:complete len:324 (+) Transcript_54113:2-973(+)